MTHRVLWSESAPPAMVGGLAPAFFQANDYYYQPSTGRLWQLSVNRNNWGTRGLQSSHLRGQVPISLGGTAGNNANQARWNLGLSGAMVPLYTGTNYTAGSTFVNADIIVFMVVPSPASSNFTWTIAGTGAITVPTSVGFSWAVGRRTAANTVDWRVMSVQTNNTVNHYTGVVTNAARNFTSTQSFSVFGYFLATVNNY